MKIELDTDKSAWENAAKYFEQAKKWRRKREALEKRIAEMEREGAKIRVKAQRKREWYHKFRYMITDGGFLVIGGKDAHQNQVIVAKYLEKNDLYFHADIHGAPSVVLKKGKNAGERDIEQAAWFAAIYSKAWNQGVSVDVFYVEPHQLKSHVHGMYVPKGGFVIEGEKRWVKGVKMEIGLYLEGNELKIAPDKGVIVVPGQKSKKQLAERIAKIFEKKANVIVPVDWIIEKLPGKGVVKRIIPPLVI